MRMCVAEVDTSLIITTSRRARRPAVNYAALDAEASDDDDDE